MSRDTMRPGIRLTREEMVESVAWDWLQRGRFRNQTKNDILITMAYIREHLNDACLCAQYRRTVQMDPSYEIIIVQRGSYGAPIPREIDPICPAARP